MEKTIQIGNKEIKMRTSAALPRLYRIKFRRDLFKDLTSLTNQGEDMSFEAVEIFENLAYIMAAHADINIETDVSEWLSQFEQKELYEALPELLSLWNEETEQESVEKKENEQ